MIRAGVALVVLLANLPARGDEDRETRARAHYEVGLGMYHLGNYRDAVREFSAGYALAPRPEFLINLGQAYRKLHDLDRAREMFKRYLAATDAQAPDRKQVQQLLEEVERARGTGPPSATESPPAATEPSAATAPVAATAAPSALVAAPATPSRKSALRRFWWTIPVGAVLVGAAVGLTLYFTLPPSQVACKSATISCVDLR
ncbi:MAG: Tetratricopeptide repeat domain protein [bacterium]|nr:Tetratricopeptide repeat domain protein [bacterium]